MGLFDKLFEKKFCAVCGNEIKIFGNRKLEDGNLCKNCANKLSPWFSERRSSTVAEIKEQLDYRERNLEAVKEFRITRTIGGDDVKILLDEHARKFVVTSARNLVEDNPDVLDYSQVTGCKINVEEDKNEVQRRDKEGNMVSYNPPRYTYEYDFYVELYVNHPYFDEMNFKLNSSSVMTTPETGALPNRTPNPRLHPEYREYEQMGQEIVEILTNVRETAREEEALASAPKTASTCPWCGATTVGDDNGCCEFCGGLLK